MNEIKSQTERASLECENGYYFEHEIQKPRTETLKLSKLHHEYETQRQLRGFMTYNGVAHPERKAVQKMKADIGMLQTPGARKTQEKNSSLEHPECESLPVDY